MALGRDAQDARRRALLAKMAHGDTDAFEDFYNENVRLLYGFVRSYLHSDDEVKDVLQETFLAVWKASGTFRGNAQVTTWLFSIAKHKALNVIAQYKPVADINMAVYDSMQIADFAEQMVSSQAITDAIKTLPPEIQRMIHLVYEVGLNYSEVGKLLGIPPGTVKSRMHYMKQALRQAYSQGGDGNENVSFV